MNEIADRMQKMGLTKSGITENKQRVILSRIVTYCSCGRFRITIALTGYKIVKRIFFF